jgi:glycosyltransferase involved in cell wall biosynthesis
MARFQGQIRVGTQGPNIGSSNISGSEEGIARKEEIFRKFNEEQERKRKGHKKDKDKDKDKDIDKDRKERQDKKDREKNRLIVHLNNKLDELNIIVKENKDNKRPWFFGLEEKFGEWWHGLTIDQVRDKLKNEQFIYDNDNDNDNNSSVGGSASAGKGLGIIKKESKRDIIDKIISEQILSCSVELVARGLIELPKDSKRRLVYVYPMGKKQSFNLVAKHQIKFFNEKYLADKGLTFNKYVEIQELDWSEVSGETSDVCNWKEKRNVLLHPFLYPFTSKESFLNNARNFARLLVTKNKIGGFDVSDSDRVSDIAVELVNKVDLIMVPSTFSRDAFINSGIRPEIVQVLPHGLDDYFLMDDVDINVDIENEDNENIDNEDIDNKGNNDVEKVKKTLNKLRELREKGKILILYFVLHSGYRKGADLVEEVMKRVEKRLQNEENKDVDGNKNEVCLVIRSKSLKYFENMDNKDNVILVDEWLGSKDLVKLYDLCDICLVPSRGGGWEMNAMESTSRGLVTLVPNAGCFLDMKDYLLMVDIDKDKIVKPLPGNAIHIGNGYEIDMNDFENKLLHVINNFHEYKDKFEDNMYDVREKYSWRNVVIQLDDILSRYGFYE